MKLAHVSTNEDERPVVKGLVDERAPATSEQEEDVNVVRWARQFVADLACQNTPDAKAFKGRGKHQELRLLLAELADVERYMEELVKATRAVPGHVMLLAIHNTTASGLQSVRWRSRVGTMKHLSWAEAAQTAANLPPPMPDWYRRVTEHCITANERHKELRKAIGLARKVVARSEPHLYPRGVGR